MTSELAETGKLAVCEKAIELASVGREAAIELCCALDEVYETGAFTVSQYGDEETFLMELGLAAGTVSKYRTIGRGIRIHGIDRREAARVRSIEGLYYAAKQETREQALEMLDQAIHLKRDDVAKLAKGQDSCAHSWEEVAMRKCGKCHALERCG